MWREFLFILVVILILLGLTAIRYRKQIASIMGVARMLKEAKNAAAGGGTLRGEKPSMQLVNCARCGVWVPQNKAIKKSDAVFYCSNACLRSPVSS